jgi:predicted nucleic acid-binding Zn ribbon protein
VARPPFLRRGSDRQAPQRRQAPPRRSLPHPGILRRERRGLLRVREERLRDLGGLMLEMYRRDQFRQDLLVERCEELMALDDRLQELETLLAAAVSVRRVAPAARCSCGAPLPAGAHFCANCGRPVAAAPPVVACTNCGAAVSADAKFCAACGQAVGPEQQSEAAAVEPKQELLEALPAPPARPEDGG